MLTETKTAEKQTTSTISISTENWFLCGSEVSVVFGVEKTFGKDYGATERLIVCV